VTRPGLPDFASFKIPKQGKIYQIATKVPNGHDKYQIDVINSKWPLKIPTFFIPRPSKIYQN
jgi:hypothetical protein